MSELLSGITYYKKISQYEGDVTKKCGLTGPEIDSNFYFLRGNDIKEGIWDSTNEELCLVRENGDTIIIDGIDFGAFLNLSGTSYDTKEGILTLNINGYTFDVSGFSTCDCERLQEEYEALSGTVDDIICRLETAEGNEESIRLSLVEAEKDIQTNKESITDLEEENVKIKGYLSGVEIALLEIEKALSQYSGETIVITEEIRKKIKEIYEEIYKEKKERKDDVSSLTKSVDELEESVNDIEIQLSSITINDDAKKYEYNLYVNDEIRGTVKMPPPQTIKDAWFSGTTLYLIFETAEGEIIEQHVDIRGHIEIESVKDVKVNGVSVLDKKGVANVTVRDYMSDSLTVDSSIGGFNAGDIIDSGTTLEDIIKKLFAKREEYPTYNIPYLTITNPNTNKVMAVGSTFVKEEITYTKNDGEYISSWTQPSPNVIFSNEKVTETDFTVVNYGNNILSYTIEADYSEPTQKAITNLGNEYEIGDSGHTSASTKTTIIGVYPVYSTFYKLNSEEPWSEDDNEIIIPGNTYIVDYAAEDNTKRKAFFYNNQHRNLVKVEAYNKLSQEWNEQDFTISSGPAENMSAYIRISENYEGPIKYRFTLEDK